MTNYVSFTAWCRSQCQMSHRKVHTHLPAGHSVHDPAFCKEYCPAGHMDGLSTEDAGGQKYPARHGPSHADVVAPVTKFVLYRPAGHTVHVDDPSVEYFPGSQREMRADVPAGQ
jgi:hypothetical protein